jgi:hypothetical protein
MMMVPAPARHLRGRCAQHPDCASVSAAMHGLYPIAEGANSANVSIKSTGSFLDVQHVDARPTHPMH